MPTYEYYESQGLRFPAVLNVGTSATDMQEFYTCELKRLLRNGAGLTIPSEPIALTFGSAVHAGLDAWYRNLQDSHSVRRQKAANAIHASWPKDSKGEPVIWQKDDHRVLPVAQVLVDNYILKVDLGGAPLRPMILSTGRPAVEFKLAWQPIFDTVAGKYPNRGKMLPLDLVKTYRAAREAKQPITPEMFDLIDPAWPVFAARIDMLVELDGEVWVVDHKTTSQMGPTFVEQYDPHIQMQGYSVTVAKCLPEILNGRPVAGTIINGLKASASIFDKDGNLKPLVKGEAGTGRTGEGRKTGNLEYQRVFVRMTEGRVNEWLLMYVDTVKTMMKHHEQRIIRPNWQSCHSYGGCPYRDLCRADPRNRERILQNVYSEEKVDTLESALQAQE